MRKPHKYTNKRLYFGILTAVCVCATVVVFVGAAYFAKGEFKDVFVNKADYFAANVLYSIGSIDAEKHTVGSLGVQRDIMIYNYDTSTGDFNSFDVQFAVYAWLDETLAEGKSYEISVGGESVSFTNQNEIPTKPIFQGLELKGGQRSTVTLTVKFGFTEKDDIDALPGLYVVAVPTSPRRLEASFLGAQIKPTKSETFAVKGSFDQEGDVADYAAFTYRVSTDGAAPEGAKIRIKWKSDALTLMRVNGEDPAGIDTIQEGDFGDGFDRMIEWTAQTNSTDNFVFFRNANTETSPETSMWSAKVTWDDMEKLVRTEYELTQ